ncbi:MAG: hypothetical protein JO125_16895 [Chloroflexi bacterium]|nr:hypothetical protein [Ktedonobacteraceae bacterium]MBV8821343.1 hypothetical protein [Ktedonobacteraceae bacterium]MBV9021394.1 hypothetical protein [Ktedonobacteraceae bacterium]MBV9709074.1 hypothetical protein [Chloroflexota bacterium]
MSNRSRTFDPKNKERDNTQDCDTVKELPAPQKQRERPVKERVQLDFSPEALERLDLIKENIGASTRAETIRQALRLFDWFVRETQDAESVIEVTNKEGKVTSRFKALLVHSALCP